MSILTLPASDGNQGFCPPCSFGPSFSASAASSYLKRPLLNSRYESDSDWSLL